MYGLATIAKMNQLRSQIAAPAAPAKPSAVVMEAASAAKSKSPGARGNRPPLPAKR